MLHLFGGNDLLFVLNVAARGFLCLVRVTSFLVCRVYLLNDCQCLWILSSVVLYDQHFVFSCRCEVSRYLLFMPD